MRQQVRDARGRPRAHLPHQGADPFQQPTTQRGVPAQQVLCVGERVQRLHLRPLRQRHGLVVPDDDPETARRALATIRTASREALRDLGRTVGLLRDEARPEAPGAPTSGVADLPRLVTTATATGLDVQLLVDGAPVRLPSIVDTTVHRIVQEALTNVLRHAQASAALVHVVHGEQHLTVTVTDDGRGSAGGEGHGLRGMQERVALLGGHFLARDRPEGGFQVSAVLPLQTEPAPAAG